MDQNTFRGILASQTIQGENKIRDILIKIPFLENLDESFLNKMISSLQPVTFSPNERVIQKGDEGKVFYIIKEGKVKVHDIQVGETSYEDNILGPGDYFGERALMTSEPRVANVTAMDYTETLCLPSTDFKKVLGNLSDLVLKSNDRRRLVSV